MYSCDQCNILLHIEEYKTAQILRIHYERLAHRYLRQSIQDDLAWTYSAYLVNKEQADRYKYQMNNLCCKRCRRILDITRQKEEVFTKEIEKWQEKLGDIAVVIDLIAQLKGTNLTNCAISKFNQTSEDKGSNVRIKV